MSGGIFRHTGWKRLRKVCLVQQLRSARGFECCLGFVKCCLDFSQGDSPFPLLFEPLGSNEGLNVPAANPEQEAGRNIDQRMRVRPESKDRI